MKMDAAQETLGPATGSSTVPSASQESTPLRCWLMLALLFGFYVLGNIDQRIIMLLVDPIKADLGLSDFQISLLLGPAFSVFYGLFCIPLGWAADRYPRKLVIFLGVSAWSACTAISAAARSFGMLFFARAAVGIGESSFSPAAFSLLADSFPKRRLSVAVAILGFAPKIGYSVALLVGGVLFSFASSLSTGSGILSGISAWQICFILVGLPGLLIAPLMLLIVEPNRHVVAASEGSHSDSLFGYVRREAVTVLSLVIGFGMVALAAGALVTWVPTYMSRAFNYTPAQAGVVIGIVSLASVAVMISKAMLVDWLHAKGRRDIYVRFYIWVVVATLPLAVLAFRIRHPIFFLAVFGLMQMLTLSFPMFQALAAQAIVPPQLRARMMALFLVVTQIMFGIGPMVTAALSDYVLGGPTTLGTAMSVAGTTSLLIALALLMLGLRGYCGVLDRIEANT